MTDDYTMTVIVRDLDLDEAVTAFEDYSREFPEHRGSYSLRFNSYGTWNLVRPRKEPHE